MSNQLQDNTDEEDLNEEEIVQAILDLGNDILKNLGFEEQINDVGVFFGDGFYLEFFKEAFPEIDFTSLNEGQNEEEIAGNIQTLIDLLGEQILKYDLSHIKGEEIVSGNPEHCINLLQLVQEISVMLDGRQEAASKISDIEDEDDEIQGIGSTAKKQNFQDEDDEAQIIHEKKLNQVASPDRHNQQQNPGAQKSSASQIQSQKKGRSYSEDRGKPQFELDDIDISNEFDVNMDDEDDDDELMFQQKSGEQSQPKQQIIDDYQEDDDEEIDEEDVKMYEQFLQNNKQSEQQLANLVDDDNQKQQQHSASGPNNEDDQEDMDEDEEEMDLDNIDYDDLDPQILELAEQMGVHPKEVIKQMLKLQKDGYGDEDGEGEDDDEEEQYLQQQQQQQKQQQQRQASSSKKPQQQQRPKPLPHELINQDSDQDSYYSENELISKDKVANKKSYSAPYIIINDCFDEPLYDSEEEKELESANTTTILKNLEMQEQLAEAMAAGEGEEEMDEETQQMIMMQQQQQQQQLLIQQQQQKQNSQISEVSKSKESSQINQKNQHSSSDYKKKHLQNQQYIGQDDEEDEQEIDMGSKLQQLQQNQQQQQYNEEEEDDQEGEDDDEDMLIDLDKLDDNNKQMLLEYLQQEYEKNPDQFPFPKELIEEQLMKQYNQQQKQGRQETESVRDIKSDEMVVEDNSQHNGQNEEEEIYNNGEGEEEEELTPEQQMQMQQMMMMQQQQQQEQDYGDENNEQDQQEQIQQMQYQQQQMMPRQLKPKLSKSNKPKSLRPKSAGRKKVQQQNQNYLTRDQQLQQEQILQQQQILAQLMEQNQELDIENMDPNILQQLIMAHSQQQQQQMKPKTVKRKVSATRKKSTTKNMQKLMPYSLAPRNMKILGPSTPGTQLKSFSTNRSYNPNLSKSKRKKTPKKHQPLTQRPSQIQYGLGEDQNMPQQYEMPVLSEDYLNQLSEDQLQQLLEHQQQLMMMQQNQQQFAQQNSQMKRAARPKSAKTTKSMKVTGKVPTSYAQYYQPYMNSKRKSVKPKKKKKKRAVANANGYQEHQGVMMNNYFPALEGDNQQSQTTEEGGSSNTKESKYPKFSHDLVNNPHLLAQQNMLNQQDPIDEVPPEQEEGESQEINQFYGQNEQQESVEQDQDIQQEGIDQDQEGQEGGEDSVDAMQISDEQLIQLIQNAHNLTPDQQQQLQLILQQRMQSEKMNERAQSYQNIYQILMDNVQKAKDRLANIGQPNGSIDQEGDTDQRILRQKQEFEALYRQYNHELKQKEFKKRHEDGNVQKKMQRESKIQSIKERKFQEDLLNHQKSINYKRNAQQVRLCQKVYKLASELEKNKLLAEKKEYKESITKKKQQGKVMVDALENFYKNMISMLKDKIENEKFERKIAQQAQQQAMTRMKRELNQQKRMEVDRYLQLLKQEDQRYDFESTNLQKIEQEIISLYKK